MSRMYDNKPLSNLPVHNVDWKGSWNHGSFLKEKAGVICEGTIVSQARISISSTESPASKARYYILLIRVDKAHRRKFDEKGEEIEPNFSETTKVSTGYLNSSYDVKEKGKTDKLTTAEMKSVIQNSDIEAMIQDVVAKSAKGSADINLLMKEEERDKIELPDDSPVRVKTVGKSPIIESMVVIDRTSSTKVNLTGDAAVGTNWTDKVMAMKAKDEGSGSEHGNDDEWDD